MKKIHIYISILFAINAFGQTQNLMTKTTSGRYQAGSNGGVYIYDDGSFALFGYATLVLGTYVVDSKKIHFTPYIPKQPFTVMGRKNTANKQGTTITFSGSFVGDGPTYISLDNNVITPIFDKNNPGGDPYYMVKLKKSPKIITLYLNSQRNYSQNNTYTYILDPKYNEYLFYYKANISEQQPFTGTIESSKEGKTLKTQWGDFGKVESKIDKEWDDFILEYKKNEAKNRNKTQFYYNDRLKSATGSDQLTEQFSTFDIKNYTLDIASNKFIRKNIYKKTTNYTKAIVPDYHNEDYILQYNGLPLSSTKMTNFETAKISSKALINDTNN